MHADAFDARKKPTYNAGAVSGETLSCRRTARETRR